MDVIKLETITIKEAIEVAGGDEQLYQEMLDKFRQWLQQQSHLPQEISDNRLRYTLLSSKFNFEKAKRRLDLIYTLRNLLPEIFDDYDPLSKNITRIHKSVQWVPLPTLTPEKYRVSCFKLLPDEESFHLHDILRYALMTLDIRAKEDTVNSEIIIADYTHLTLGHVLKYTPSVLKKVDLCMEAYGMRFKVLYAINAPPVFEQMLALIKKFLKPKLFGRIQIVTTGIESLYNDLPRSILPADYGGYAPSLDTLTDMWRAKLMEQRDWLLDQNKLKVNESLRVDSVINPDDLFGVSGTFRKLDID
ncbi:PREDICTED: alpha-tocopherol transfer protein-like [Dinoponera quadriceps]|uniref:Alpha-tocopherol transfer protein-like n=1 Tax=Dinoponera quadriceps TaxID=609295 RepID=A0A6P3Y377_DINQU|nr:PREDICTED: alpha-tocopherol transfer protein-like [Dinoponera quadriceps]XP_014485294.1 PREDICTED: alpha-tocopherol transfer protein-like [Dinoponera quadriceps]XP_014485295.1 PREDICTED: alpha-tocopherol transfer protein-like [Dinoponera quadriceps]XP_014485296.1 PREDICTED: alpha-tocopherol transfer protein-like [Dinoponera quadriceps]